MSSRLRSLVDEVASAIADRVVDRLRAGEFVGYVDQSSSPLGRRRHIAAVRSGQLRGIRVGRRYLARRDDVEAYVSRRAPATPPSGAENVVDELAAELGLTRRRNAG